MGCNISTESEKEDKFLLITANVGSLFENQDAIQPIWLEALSKKVEKGKPRFIALHCQEIGGKNYTSEDLSEKVEIFYNAISSCEALSEYQHQLGYIDEDHKSTEQYTALGSFYFIHKKVENLQLYNFVEKEFKEVEGKTFHRSELSQLPNIRKEKFPQKFFPNFRWSRKGYIRTRWRIGSTLIELVNIHLFHDESNLKATEESPSSYSVFRKNALDFVVNKLSDGEDKCESGIFFIFGDLNFRLNLKELIQNILPNSQPQQTRSAENQVIKSTYRDDADANTDGEVVMTLEKKCFDVKKSIIQKDEKFMHLKKFDCEMQDQEKSLKEFPVAFPPSYPYSEDPEAPEPYMKTRCPAWCDRVLLSHQAWQLLREQKSEEDVEYGRIGDAVCMGDHKPIFLLFSVNDE